MSAIKGRCGGGGMLPSVAGSDVCEHGGMAQFMDNLRSRHKHILVRKLCPFPLPLLLGLSLVAQFILELLLLGSIHQRVNVPEHRLKGLLARRLIFPRLVPLRREP